MSKRIISSIILIMIFMFTACSGESKPVQSGYDKENTESSVVADLLCKEVYIEEGEGLKPYIIASTDYNGTTLLLRKYVLNEQRRMNDYYSTYEDSEMDIFLNTEFFDSFPEKTKEIILDTEIECCPKYELRGNRPLKSDRFLRKIFLLSGTETNVKVVSPTEGKVLDYFNENKGEYYEKNGLYKTLAHSEDGETQSWWLRTPNTWDKCIFYAFSYDEGKITDAPAYYELGIRPAFCISNDTPIEKAEISGENVYVIKY